MEPKPAEDVFKFSWELDGYESLGSFVRSPEFTTPFKSTEWYLELDFTNLRNKELIVPGCLRRHYGVGPPSITMDVRITATMKEYPDAKYQTSINAKQFNEGLTNYWGFVIEGNQQQKEWLSSRQMTIEVELEHVKTTDDKSYYCNSDQLKLLSTDLTNLYEKGTYHDLQIKVIGESKEETFRVHKCILAVRWPKLLSILAVKPQTTRQPEVKKFTAIPAKFLRWLLYFVYSGDTDFMYDLLMDVKGFDIYKFIKEYNLYKLSDKLNHSSPQFKCSHLFQSYRCSFKLCLRDIQTEYCLCELKSCEVPLMPSIATTRPDDMKLEDWQKQNRHIKYMDIRLYVEKGPMGYNWLKFSILLGKLPKKKPIVVKCRLYVEENPKKDSEKTSEKESGGAPEEESEKMETDSVKISEEDLIKQFISRQKKTDEILYLLTEQHLEFGEDSKVEFNTAWKEGKTIRYIRESEPVITWGELIDSEMNLLWDRKDYDCEVKDFVTKQDLQFKFEFKLSDGESAWTMDYGTTISKFESGFEDLSDDMDLVFHDFTYKDAKACMAKNFLDVHKSIITARSPESLWDDSGRVQVPVCESDMFHVFINYLYTGKMLIQPGSELHNLEYLAKKWNLDMLKQALKDLILL